VRAAIRFAQSSILEVFHHLNGDSANNPLAHELRPSSDPTHPSIYRVDLDPVDVPALSDYAETEGVMQAFEAYALEPQENGYIGMTECVTATYPVDLLPDSDDPSVLLKVFEPSQSDAGDLRVMNSATELSIFNLIPGAFEGDPWILDTGDSNKPTYSEAGFMTPGQPGITFDSSLVDSSRTGILAREFNPGSDRTAPSYVRVEEGKQYKIRFHVTSTYATNRQPQMRMRTRSIKFAWSQKHSIGGAWATGGTVLNMNNTIAQQMLPGVGCMNPDRNGTENGGWYTLIMTSPMSADIRPEYGPDVPLGTRMPNITAEPGPGVDAPSRRDLRLGADLQDTESTGANHWMESGGFTIDRIEIRSYDMVR
jgi:hypothetical protein